MFPPRVNQHTFGLSTFRDSPLSSSHWFKHAIMALNLELMLSVVLPDAKMVVSSANKAVCKGKVVAAGRSLMYIENRRGPRTDPCGTPQPMWRYGETVSLTASAWTLLE